jgi:predicted RecA/RadA family phage recombinase
MAQNYIQPGDVIEITAGATITSGQMVKVGAIVGVALNSATSGQTVRVRLKGVFNLPKAAGAITVGALVYLVEANGNLSTTASGNTAVGHAVKAAASGDATVEVRLAQ